MGLLKPFKMPDNKIYDVTITGQFTGSLDYPPTLSGKFIIDSLGNFVLEIGSLDYFLNEHSLKGIFADGLTDIINKYKITLGKNYQGVFSYVESGMPSTPYACGCGIYIGVTETSDLYFNLTDNGINPPIGATAIITGKLY